MLTELFIRNLAIIDELSVPFQPGFNVLTGETGAGKSIIIHALSFLLGERGDTDLIRSGEETLLVEAAFDLRRSPQVRETAGGLELELEDDALVLSRELSRAGRSRSRVNGRPATLGMLRELGRALVDIHGQHEHQSLLEPSWHLRFLDSFAGQELGGLKERYRKRYRQLLDVERELSALRQEERDRNQRLDLLRFQAEEIDRAQLREGEEESLRQEHQILANAEMIAEHLNAVATHLSADGAALDRLAAAIQELTAIAELNPDYRQSQELLSQAQTLAQEVSFDVRRYLGGMEFDPQRLAELEERLHLIRRLMRKYGESTGVILRYRTKIEEELQRLESGEVRLEELRQERGRLRGLLGEAATTLSEARSRTAAELERAVQDHLTALALERAEFRVALETTPVSREMGCDGDIAFRSEGIDRVQLLIATNPGEPLKPLAKVASGGELSRIMLALKASLHSAQDVPVLVFDEIDAGIGGQTAEVVGRKLSAVARYAQVLCVTHLPQIAGPADWHLKVDKVDLGARVGATAMPVQGEGRVTELARMLSGIQVTEASLQHAQELLAVGARP